MDERTWLATGDAHAMLGHLFPHDAVESVEPQSRRSRMYLIACARRVAGVEAASQALGDSDLSTTLGSYGHQDQRDLERAMEAFVEAREAKETASRGNDSPSRLD